MPIDRKQQVGPLESRPVAVAVAPRPPPPTPDSLFFCSTAAAISASNIGLFFAAIGNIYT
jgi:hypothetical protein